MFEIGSSLREARVRKGLDFADCETGTKIRAKYLRALEDERFDVLPAQTYVKGFLHTYAEFLGLDGRLYVDEYTSRFWVDEEGGQRLARRVRVRRRRHRTAERNMLIVTLVGIGAVTALVIAAWRFGGGSSPSAAPRPQAAAAHRRPAGSVFVVRATGGSSLVEVHADSASGKLLYHGTLEAGEAQRFRQARLWLSVDAPAHVVFTYKRRPVQLPGRCPRTIEVTPRQMVSTAACR